MIARRCPSFSRLWFFFFIKDLSEAARAGNAWGPSLVFAIFPRRFWELSEQQQGQRIIQRDERWLSVQVFPGTGFLLKFRCREVIFKGWEHGLAFAADISVPQNSMPS